MEDDEASGLIVKLPLLARSAFIRRASTVDQVRKVLALAGKRYPHAKFATIQHCLANAKVYQVVVLAGVARYVVVPRASNPWPRVSFSSADHTAIRTFAEEAIRNLQTHFPFVTCDGLVSVAVMLTKSGRFVVNNLRTLESNLHCEDHDQQLVLMQAVTDFWVGRLQLLIDI